MNPSFPKSWGPVAGLGLLLAAAGCTGSGGGGSSGMSIVSCSLTCNDSSTSPSQITCGITNIFENQEIRVTFSSPIDATTLSNNTFQVAEVGTGKTPAGTLSLDPSDPRVLIYRPQLTFDSTGNPIFGFLPDKSYFFKVPGTVLDPLGPHIKNRVGTANTSRLQCTLIASEGVGDAKPGRPRVTVTLDTVKSYDAQGNPATFELNVPAQGAVNVFRNSPVRLVFDDVMNPATIANPVTGKSNFITTFVDTDGDINTTADWVRFAGVFTLAVDQVALRTTAVFTPTGALPSAGTDVAFPRKIVFVLSSQISDLRGNTLINPSTISFTPEVVPFAAVEVQELFSGNEREDTARTGSPWGGGTVRPGLGGGSGRLGDLVVPAGELVVLNTDFEDFSAITNPLVFNPKNIIDRTPNFSVSGGVFEFARLRVDAGGVLRFTGTNPVRLLVRGEVAVQGLIDVSGGSGNVQNSTALAGGQGGIPGPNAGTGGSGGSRPNGAAFVAEGGVANPSAGPSNVLDAATYTAVNGKPGLGMVTPDTLSPTPVLVGGGGGGLAWPQPTAANPALHMPASTTDLSGIQVDNRQQCMVVQPAAPGGGGAYVLAGGLGHPLVQGQPGLPLTLAPDALGGDNTLLGIDDTIRSLSPQLGLLRGGSGGGGGGAHLELTGTNGIGLNGGDCTVPLFGALVINSYHSHSAAGGGGGGGGIHIAAGRRFVLSGIIDASGGDGGSGSFPPQPGNFFDLAQAGGGGAGGSILVQSRSISIVNLPNRLTVVGGLGGEGAGTTFQPPARPSLGGVGSPGILRLESDIPLSVPNEAFKVRPSTEDLQEVYAGALTIQDLFTTATWTPVDVGADGWSGAESCWIQPPGNYFRLGFTSDDANGLGWDLRLRIVGQADPQSFRGENDLFPVPLEQVFGTEFGTSPVVVRFQAARVGGILIDPCVLPEVGDTPLVQESLTDWVSDPTQLSSFFGSESLTPNIFRFVVLWDRNQADLAQIQGIEDVTFRLQPD